jgi:hypothetical protein
VITLKHQFVTFFVTDTVLMVDLIQVWYTEGMILTVGNQHNHRNQYECHSCLPHTALGLKPGLCGEKPLCLSHITALCILTLDKKKQRTCYAHFIPMKQPIIPTWQEVGWGLKSWSGQWWRYKPLPAQHQQCSLYKTNGQYLTAMKVCLNMIQLKQVTLTHNCSNFLRWKH